MKKMCVFLALVMATSLLCGAALAETIKVTIYDSDGLTVIKEMDVEKNSKLTVAELGIEAREGYVIDGVYVTKALLRAFDENAAFTRDTNLYIAWKSDKKDERSWMLAGGLLGYPENNWGRAWPQDDFLMQPVEGEFNTFAKELNLYEGDEFKIAVIGEGYEWSATDSLDSRNIVKNDYLTGGEDAFDTGANIKVMSDGLYRITLKTDAETIALCKISVEKIGEAKKAEFSFSFQIQGNFNGWGADAAANLMKQNGSDNIWYAILDVTKEDYDTANGSEFAMFGIKNLENGDWYDLRKVDEAATPNFAVTEGTYMVYLALDVADKITVTNFFAEPAAYYVVGTCGAKGWAADANAENTAYQMTKRDDGTYALKVTFTDEDTDSWTEGKVAFKIAYGAKGCVANEFWFGTPEGDNIMVAPGEYTITFDPATGKAAY